MAVKINQPPTKGKGSSGKEVKPVSPDGTFRIALGNSCLRYVTPSGTLYEKDKTYSVDAKTRAALFALRDESGVRYFFPAEVLERNAQRRAVQTEDEATLQEMEENGEIDTGMQDTTGAMALVDADGDPVGVTDGNVSV